MIEQPGVTLQISLGPTDLPHARYVPRQQLGQWAHQVDDGSERSGI